MSSQGIQNLVLISSAPMAQAGYVGMAVAFNLANPSGAANTAVVVAVSGLQLPANGNYVAQIEPNQNVTTFVSAKTQTGFNVTLTPIATGASVAAGTFDVLVFF